MAGSWSSVSPSPRRTTTTATSTRTFTSMLADPTLSFNLARDVGEVLEYHFMVNALVAGSVVAVMAGLLGWFMVLRSETFAGHTLAMMALPGATGAALIGVPASW